MIFDMYRYRHQKLMVYTYTISEDTIQVRVHIQNWKVHMRTISEDSCTPTCTAINIRYAHEKLCNFK